MPSKLISMPRPFVLAVKASIPVFLSTFPLGAIYGFLFTEAGNQWYEALLFSFFVVAGAMQFLALSMAGTDTSMLALALALIPLGIRNVFYGLQMKERYQKAPLLLRCYLAHGLVDAIYMVFTLKPRLSEKQDLKYITWLTLITHCYWVLGTLFGALFGRILKLPEGLEFCLTAFFAATLTEQLIKNRDFVPLCIACITLLCALFFFPNHFFIAAVAMASVTCLILPRKAKESP